MALHPFLIFLIYLFYGAAFLAIGAAITSRRKTFTNLRIAGLFWLLAVFAFSHAFHEWLEMFRHLELPVGGEFSLWLRKGSLLLAFLSFFFLFLFGVSLHGVLDRRTRVWFGVLAGILVVLFVLLAMGRHPDDGTAWLRLVEYDLRRLIGFPATFVTGSGLLLYARRLRGLSARGAGNFAGAGFAFMLYGVLTGLIPSGTMLLVPVEIWRGLAAFFILHFIMYALDLFLDEREAMIAERLKAAARSEKLSAVGRLAAGVAHEINNPLASVSLQLELLHKDPAVAALPDKVMNRLQTIERNIDKSARIARELLTFAGGRQLAERPESVDLARTIAGAWQLAAHRAEGYRLQSDLAAGLTIDGLPLKLEELFLNLFLNAMDAMPGGGLIEVLGRREQDWVVVRVRDHGAGIAPEQLNLVLEPFFTTKEIGEGTGLGLAICYGIMELHGGTIEMAARRGGVGTEVTLAFPRR